MTSKYKVVMIAYKNVEGKVVDIISKFSVLSIKTLETLNQSHDAYASKGFGLNDRINIYMNWFDEKAKKKIREGYTITILEIPQSKADVRLELLGLMDTEYGDKILVLEDVDV